MRWPIRALWEGATEEERKGAHETAAAILEWWLGRANKSEVAGRLKVPPLRVWQLSQQALSGMVAGLLRQPRWRKKEGVPMGPGDDRKALQKENAQLKRRLELTESLVKLLRDLPENRGRRDLPAHPEEKRRRRKRVESREPAPDRGMDAEPSPPPEG